MMILECVQPMHAARHPLPCALRSALLAWVYPGIPVYACLHTRVLRTACGPDLPFNICLSSIE